MRLGLMILPDQPWQRAVDRWRTAEALGFESAWTYDHLWWRSLSDMAWYSAVPVLTAAATVTDRLTIGSLVSSANLRHPVTLVKDAVTIDDIANGRFVLGLGAGSPGAGDALVVHPTALSPAARADRFGEFVELTDRLLREPVTAYSGRCFTVTGCRMVPVRQPRLPLAIAASGPRGMALVARYADVWVTMGPIDWSRGYVPDECLSTVIAQTALLKRACERADRDIANLERLFVVTPWAGDPTRTADACLALAERYAGVGITHMVLHWPRERGVYAGDPAVLHQIAERVMPQIRGL